VTKLFAQKDVVFQIGINVNGIRIVAAQAGSARTGGGENGVNLHHRACRSGIHATEETIDVAVVGSAPTGRMEDDASLGNRLWYFVY